MWNSLAAKIFGSRNDRLIKQYKKTVAKINALEPQIQALDDDALKAKTTEFRERLAKGETLDQLLPEAFAVVREASQRVLGLRHYDVQMIGGIVLHQGKIAEMRTGEGKTLVATLAVYLNALPGKGVHVVTVNDYLARRDGEELGGFIWLTSAMLLAHKDVPIFRSLFTLLGGAPLERGDLSWTLFGITLLAGLTMVTNIPYYSFKDLGGRRSMPFVMLVLVALLLAVISIEPATMLFLLFVGYALSGYLIYAWRKATGQHASIVSTSTEEPDEQGLHR